MKLDRHRPTLHVGAAAVAIISTIVPIIASAVPPPPPAPDVLARIQSDCRMAPRETIPLVKSVVPLPRAPAQLNPSWAMQLTPSAGAHLGTVIGLTRTWSGTIVAATDRGYWIRVPSDHDEAWGRQSGPVAVSIRDVGGSPHQMAFAGWSGEPGYVGLGVAVAVPGRSALLRYEVAGCFPNSPPLQGPAIPPGDSIFRLEPSTNGPAGEVVLRLRDGSLRKQTFLDFEAGRQTLRSVSREVLTASNSAMIPLALGCDELTLHRQGSETLVRTTCSEGYLSSLREMWARPYHQHRQPPPISGTRTVGRIEAPIVAVSDARLEWPPGLGFALRTVPRGDRTNPGVPCSFLLAAQERADAPIFIYGFRPYCAYNPRDPSGAPFPPPPPP
jgi:hypothetical protein